MVWKPPQNKERRAVSHAVEPIAQPVGPRPRRALLRRAIGQEDIRHTPTQGSLMESRRARGSTPASAPCLARACACAHDLWLSPPPPLAHGPAVPEGTNHHISPFLSCRLASSRQPLCPALVADRRERVQGMPEDEFAKVDLETRCRQRPAFASMRASLVEMPSRIRTLAVSGMPACVMCAQCIAAYASERLATKCSSIDKRVLSPTLLLQRSRCCAGRSSAASSMTSPASPTA
jgi:hypothetical protein